MASTPPQEHAAVIVAHLADRTAATCNLDWIVELADRAEQYSLSVPDIRLAASDLAWVARENGQAYPGDAEWALARGLDGSESKRLVLAYVHGQRLRYDFRFELLFAQCNGWLREFGDDALILGLATFGALGAREDIGLDLYARAAGSANADNKSRHVCLAAIWFADHLEDQPTTLLELSAEMMTRGEGDGNVHRRRATALRKLGRYQEALVEIDRAIDQLPIGNNLIHQEYVQERLSIIAAQDMDRRAEVMTQALGEQILARADERIQAATAVLDERISEATARMNLKVDNAQHMMSASLLKMVEVLGLFVTLTGFLIGSGAVIVKAQSFGQRAIAMGLLVVGSLVFFGLLRAVTGFRRRA
jgi:tetratricopeptide (TPR) repeat protein